MIIKHLFHTVDTVSSKQGDYQEHATPVRELLGQEGMRVIGRAYDQGIIKEGDAHEVRKLRARRARDSSD